MGLPAAASSANLPAIAGRRASLGCAGIAFPPKVTTFSPHGFPNPS
jgi:hypothetical protein